MATSITWASVGTLEFGTSEQPLPLPDDYGMAGYSLGGKKGHAGSQTLYARTLALKDAGGEEATLCIVDLMCPSLALFEAVVAKTGIPAERLILAGTHTHTAPGHFYGNSFYRVFAQPLRPDAVFEPNLAWIDELGAAIAAGVSAAWTSLRPGVVGVGRADCYGVARNRSEAPFASNPEATAWSAPGMPGEHATAGLHGTRRAIDPRVTCIAARPTGAGDAAAFAFYACHATALGPKQTTYHRDWPGYAIDKVESRHPNGVVAALGLGCAGDVSPLPPGEEEGDAQGEPLAQTVGATVGDVVADILAALPASTTPLTLEVSGGAWAPGATHAWDVGYPILFGAEDGRTELLGAVLREGMRKREGTRKPGDTQWPKRSVLPLLKRMLRKVGLNPSPWHPLHRLRLGTHEFVTVPGEPTTVAGFRMEGDALGRPGVSSASLIGYSGDYAGYFTTAEEYALQHYEGAHTLYGEPTLDLLRAAVGAPSPMPPPGASLP
ncbi:MAG: neutral/alkaline non-lysosomal ceramidase N-terminal domain-containing protein [Polyangiales bacterium]|nr:neutral/alkaline non-lysosomal ceramidase N-terminal domain-containing protein [Sandaracinaceae bacterium]